VGITLGVVVFLAIGLGVAGGLSIIWMRRNAGAMEEVTRHSVMIEDLRAKTSQWEASTESLLKGGSKDFFHFSSALLEEKLSTLQSQPVPADEQKLLKTISSNFFEARTLLEGLLNREDPVKFEEVSKGVDLRLKEISRNVEVLMSSHKVHAEKVRIRVDKTEDIGKCISLAIPSMAILLSVLLVFVLGRGVIRSVGALVTATRTMAEGDLSRPIGLKAGDEFGEIASAFEEMRKELKLKEQKLAEMSVTDALTGLYNRRYLNVKLEEEIARARRFHHLLSLIFLDIDHFKKYNDLYGHQGGDQVLEALAAAISRSIREKIDTPCRYGGEEFVIIVPESSTIQGITVAERILKDFGSKPFYPKSPSGGASQEPVYVTFSAGVSALRENEDNSEKLLHRADQAMFQAKVQGRNRVVAM
jgi:diguanylate cyclase (GGDEF)-like protein